MELKNPSQLTVSENTVFLARSIAEIQHLTEPEVIKRALILYKQYIRHIMSRDTMKQRIEFFKFLKHVL